MVDKINIIIIIIMISIIITFYGVTLFAITINTTITNRHYRVPLSLLLSQSSSMSLSIEWHPFIHFLMEVRTKWSRYGWPATIVSTQFIKCFPVPVWIQKEIAQLKLKLGCLHAECVFRWHPFFLFMIANVARRIKLGNLNWLSCLSNISQILESLN